MTLPARGLLLLAAVLGAAGAAPAQDPAPVPEPYLRLREEAEGVKILEAASRSFTPADGKGPRIHLVSAIHIADAPFYAAMQERLDRLELVLYEGVKPAGAGATEESATPAQKATTTRTRLDLLRTLARGQRERSGAYPGDADRLVEGAGKRWAPILRGVLVDGWGRPIRYALRPSAAGPAGAPEAAVFSSDGPDGKAGTEDDLRAEALSTDPPPARPGPGIQTDMARALGLAYQGDAMDESGPGWRCCDMSFDELQRRFDAAGADATELMALLDGTSLTARLVKGIFGLVGMSRAMATMIKMTLIEALAADDGAMGGGDANARALMKVVIEERNAVVIADLRGVLAKEPLVREVAVLYGAGHMRDMERRLVGELGYRPGETVWTAAIRVDPRDTGFIGDFAKRFREAVKRAEEKQAADRKAAGEKKKAEEGPR